MRVATVDGLVTLFYDGSELYDFELDMEWSIALSAENNDEWESWDLSEECKRYWRERQSWQQVIVVEGVTEIPEGTFNNCKNIERVIMADSVIEIEDSAFIHCSSLIFIKFSINLEYIGEFAFYECDLSSVFIPPTCREIGEGAFRDNENLLIFNVLHRIEIQKWVLYNTKLISFRSYLPITDFVMNVNGLEKHALHRACCSFEPSIFAILAILRKIGIGAFNEENDIGVTPSEYLRENPYAKNITEKEIIQLYIMELVSLESENFDKTYAKKDATKRKRLNVSEVVCIVGPFILLLYIVVLLPRIRLYYTYPFM